MTSLHTTRSTIDDTSRTGLWTLLALCAFAANSLLCRAALSSPAGATLEAPAIDAASFTGVRLASGALVLALIVRARGDAIGGGSWRGGLALCAYAVGFSLAYLRISAGTGALILFGAVQVTMIASALGRGERLGAGQWSGMLLALSGLVWLVLPGLHAPDPIGAVWMTGAGVAWGVYSLLGQHSARPLAATAHNFLWSLPLAACFVLVHSGELQADARGIALAVASGALASGLGYAVWYTALRGLGSARAAIVQLAVPVLAAVGGVLLLAETASARLAVGAALVLAGVTLAVRSRSNGRV